VSIDYRPDDPAHLADPFPLYRRMQDEEPCHWSPRLKAWVLTRYEDVRRVCLDKEMSSDRLRPFFASLPPPEAQRIADIVRYLSLWMVFRDPPAHTRLRRLTSKVFHVRSMHAMRPRIESLTAWLFEQIGDRREFDFIADFAGPLPALVIMDMLGVPREALQDVKRLSDDMALFIGSSRMSAEKYAIAQAATRAMAHFFRGMIEVRRARPQDDLLSELVHLEDEGDRMTEDELVSTCILLLFAGHETTTNHIANGLLGLLRFPQELRRLRNDSLLAAAAVEELLRYDGPNGAQVRIVREAQVLHGKELRPGSAYSFSLTLPIATRAHTPSPTGSISGATGRRISRSASACTSASDSRWRGWKGRSRCRRCSRAGRTSSSRRRGSNGSIRWCFAA
jgi:cytochrome P450